MTKQLLESLVIAASQGKSEAYRSLFDVLEPQLYAFVRYRVPDHESAQDIVQDSLVALFRSLPGFTVHSTGQFYQYAYTITRRQVAKYYGNKHVTATKDIVASDESTWVAPAEDSSTEADVARALGTLDAVTREIIIFHHWARYTFAEIAEILGLEESAVRTRHHRAKEKLAALLA